MRHKTPDDLQKEIKRRVEATSQAEIAKALGISRPYLNDILNNRRGISAKMAAKLGYQEKKVYSQIES
jgi:plasmid maintenance system antidote protein VapI